MSRLNQSMGDLTDTALTLVVVLVPMVLSLTVHEYSHALAAKLLGDNTAESMGRLNLNPASHIDVVGTLLVPIILVVTHAGFFFGWAKPVPFNPTRFRRDITMRTGSMIVAAAGPASNLVMALVSMAVIAFFVHNGTWPGIMDRTDPAQALLWFMFSINVVLAIFNMIPVYPLDGQKVLTGFLPAEMAIRFEHFSHRFGMWMLMFVVLAGGRVLSYPIDWVERGIITLFGM